MVYESLSSPSHAFLIKFLLLGNSHFVKNCIYKGTIKLASSTPEINMVIKKKTESQLLLKFEIEYITVFKTFVAQLYPRSIQSESLWVGD